MSLHRFWCFTVNNPEGDIEVDLTNERVKYAVWQLEVGENGTEHFQGYLELNRTQRLSFVRRLLSDAHWEPRRGTAKQAREYCMKEECRLDGPFEIGHWEDTGQGSRNDLHEVKRKLDMGAKETQIADEHFESWCRYSRSFREYKRLKTSPRDFKTEVYYVYGPPRVGKSRWVYDNNPGAFWKQNSTWWCGYEAHDVTVLDEYYGWMPYDTFLRLLDRYPLTVQTKGGQVEFVSKKIYITSNKLPEDIYDPKYPLLAFIGRIDHWVLFDINKNMTIYKTHNEFRSALPSNGLLRL